LANSDNKRGSNLNFKSSLSTLFIFIFIFINNCSTTNAEIENVSNEEILPINQGQTNKVLIVDSTLNSFDNDEIQLVIYAQQEEIEMLKTEIKLLKESINDVIAYKSVWSDPLSIYDKKLILNNSSTIFGNIIFQDDQIVQIETLIGTLSINKSDIVRVVDSNINITDQEVVSIADVNMLKNSSDSNNPDSNYPNSAKIVLLGDFSEMQDENYNTVLSGRVQNIGNQQADFIKINFTIYKDMQSGSSVANYTVFVKGSMQEFEEGIVSNSSLTKNSIGSFELIIPSDFGPFTSYTYTIDWE